MRCIARIFLSIAVAMGVAMGVSGAIANAQDGAVVGPVVDAAPADARERAATAAWAALPDKSDAEALDWFIHAHAGTAPAALALAARYATVRARQSIPEFHTFLAAHDESAIWPRALQEVFELHCRLDRVPLYLDFLRRYPQSLQAHAARLRAEGLIFEFVHRADRIEHYDAFLEMFPDSPQTVLVAKLATQRLAIDESARAENLVGDARTARANELVVTWGDLLDRHDAEPAPILVRQAERLYRVLKQVYPDQPAVVNMVLAERVNRTIARKLDEVTQTLARHHDELRATLREEFARTRQTLDRGFEQLSRQLSRELGGIREQLQIGFASLEHGLQTLHADLKAVNETLARIDSSSSDLGRVAERVAVEFKLGFATVSTDLRTIYDGLCHVGSAIAAGVSTHGGALRELIGEVMGSTRRTFDVESRRARPRPAALAAGLAARLLATNEQSKWEADAAQPLVLSRMPDSNAYRHSVQDIYRTNARAQMPARPRHSNSFLATAIGLGATAGVARFAGPLLGVAVGAGATELVTCIENGSEIGDGLRDVVAAMVGEIVPGGDRAVRVLVDAHNEDLQTRLLLAAEALAAEYGITPTMIERMKHAESVGECLQILREEFQVTDAVRVLIVLVANRLLK